MIKDRMSDQLPPVKSRSVTSLTAHKTEDTICLNTCVHSGDMECDDGGKDASYSDCDYGTDCKDCGVRLKSESYLPPDYTDAPVSCFASTHLTDNLSFAHQGQSSLASGLEGLGPKHAPDSPLFQQSSSPPKDEKLSSGELGVLSTLGFSGR